MKKLLALVFAINLISVARAEEPVLPAPPTNSPISSIPPTPTPTPVSLWNQFVGYYTVSAFCVIRSLKDHVDQIRYWTESDRPIVIELSPSPNNGFQISETRSNGSYLYQSESLVEIDHVDGGPRVHSWFEIDRGQATWRAEVTGPERENFKREIRMFREDGTIRFVRRQETLNEVRTITCDLEFRR